MALIHQWKFNGNLEDSIGTLDFSNTRNLITFTNGVVQQSANFQSGFHGPGMSGVVLSSNPLPSTPDGAWSITFWIKDVEEDTFLTLVDSGILRLSISRYSTTNSFVLRFNNGNYSGEAIVKLGTNSTKNVFTHYAIIYGGESFVPKLYINGVDSELDFSQTFGTENIIKSTNFLFLTNNNYGYNIEDLRIYDEAINESEISSIYNTACSEITTETKLSITTQPTGTYSPLTLGTAVVEIQDSSDQLVTSSNLEITASIYSGTGTLLGTTTVQAVNGIATFSNLRIRGTGSFQISFSHTCLTSAVSNTINLSASYLQIIPPNMSLYIKSVESSGADLYTQGYGKTYKISSLYTKSFIENNSNLYIRGINNSTNYRNLFLKANLSNETNLYIKGDSNFGGSRSLFIRSVINNDINLNTIGNSGRRARLFLNTRSFPDKVSTLFIVSNFHSSLNLFTKSQIEGQAELSIKQDPQWIVPLYTRGAGGSVFNNSSLLYLQGISDTRLSYKQLSLFIRSYMSDSFPIYLKVDNIGKFDKNLNLYMKALTIVDQKNNYVNLVLYNNMLGSNKSATLFTSGLGTSQGYLPKNTNMNMFIARDSEYFANYLKTIIIGNSQQNLYSDLFISGIIQSTNSVNLSIPFVADQLNDSVEMYLNGFNPWEQTLSTMNLHTLGSEV